MVGSGYGESVKDRWTAVELPVDGHGGSWSELDAVDMVDWDWDWD